MPSGATIPAGSLEHAARRRAPGPHHDRPDPTVPWRDQAGTGAILPRWPAVTLHHEKIIILGEFRLNPYYLPPMDV